MYSLPKDMAAQIWKQVYTSILPECCKVKAWKCDSQPFLKQKKNIYLFFILQSSKLCHREEALENDIAECISQTFPRKNRFSNRLLSIQ